MLYHTVIRILKTKGSVRYIRIEGDEYESASYYEKYYSDSYSYPDNIEVVVVNQFVTED